MIRPDRHTNPDIGVINISALILETLNRFYAIQYDELMEKITDILGDKAKENYPYALNFLYLLGRIEYIAKTDSLKKR